MTIDWAAINSGGVFETFMQTLLRFEDPHVILFGRPGPDAGQDALSGDQQTVYQAKFHSHCKFADLKSDATKELENIRKYKNPKHHNSKYWKCVSTWVLVTNYAKNAGDMDKWKVDIEPEFKREGITAKLMTIEDLEPLVLKHQDVYHHYFKGKTRLFFALREAQEYLESRQINENGLRASFQGRMDLIEKIKNDFISGGSNVLPLHGPGGVGKSRLAFEVLKKMAKEGWLVYWTATRSLVSPPQ